MYATGGAEPGPASAVVGLARMSTAPVKKAPCLAASWMSNVGTGKEAGARERRPRARQVFDKMTRCVVMSMGHWEPEVMV